jgi:hypothetical protein
MRWVENERLRIETSTNEKVMKSRARQMWERLVDAYWAGARRRFEEETMPWMYPPVKSLRSAATPSPKRAAEEQTCEVEAA